MLAGRLSTASGRRLSKVVVTSRAFDSTLERLSAVADVVVSNESSQPWEADVLHGHATDAEAMLCFMTDTVSSTFLERCPQMRLVACALKGYDNFDLAACSAHGVAVTAVPDLLTAPTAELAVALTLSLGRHVLDGDRLVKAGEFRGWRPMLYGTGLAGSVVGLLGFGAVGHAIATRLQGFDVGELLYVDTREASPEALGARHVAGGVDELLRRSDVLIVCTPLNEGTRHVIDGGTLRRHAKPGLLLVNISRGSCVKEADVADALECGVLGGYAADVFEFEDWALPNRPRGIEPRLLTHERTLFTPHLGSAVATVRQRIEHEAADEIVRLAQGLPLRHRVNEIL